MAELPGFFLWWKHALGTDAPSTVSVVNIRRDNTAYTFTAPLPVGTVYFLQDVDAYEAVNVSFEDCGGNPVDASNFDFLQVSASSATIPSHSIAGPAPASWNVSSAVPGVDGPNELVGIVIQSSNVCAVRNLNTAGSNSGGMISFFGTPPAPPAPPPGPGSPAAIPTLNPELLALLGLSAAAYLRSSKKQE